MLCAKNLHEFEVSVDGCCASKHNVLNLCLASLSITGPHPSTLWYVHCWYGLLRLWEQQGNPTSASCCCKWLLVYIFQDCMYVFYVTNEVEVSLVYTISLTTGVIGMEP